MAWLPDKTSSSGCAMCSRSASAMKMGAKSSMDEIAAVSRMRPHIGHDLSRSFGRCLRLMTMRLCTELSEAIAAVSWRSVSLVLFAAPPSTRDLGYYRAGRGPPVNSTLASVPAIGSDVIRSLQRRVCELSVPLKMKDRCLRWMLAASTKSASRMDCVDASRARAGAASSYRRPGCGAAAAACDRQNAARSSAAGTSRLDRRTVGDQPGDMSGDGAVNPPRRPRRQFDRRCGGRHQQIDRRRLDCRVAAGPWQFLVDRARLPTAPGRSPGADARCRARHCTAPFRPGR